MDLTKEQRKEIHEVLQGKVHADCEYSLITTRQDNHVICDIACTEAVHRYIVNSRKYKGPGVINPQRAVDIEVRLCEWIAQAINEKISRERFETERSLPNNFKLG